MKSLAMLKSQVMKSRGPDMPMVVAGNKTDVEGALEREQTEALVIKIRQTNKQTRGKALKRKQTKKGGSTRA